MNIIRRIDLSDVLGGWGVCLGAWAAYRLGGATALILTGSFVCLAASGLLNVATLYTIAQVGNLSRAVRAPKAE